MSSQYMSIYTTAVLFLLPEKQLYTYCGNRSCKRFLQLMRISLKQGYFINHKKRSMKQNLLKRLPAVLLLAACVSQSSWAQIKNPTVINRNIPVQYVAKAEATYRVTDGIISNRFGLNLDLTGITTRDKAFNFLQSNWSSFGLGGNAVTNARYLIEKKLPGISVIRFRQYHEGLAVDQNEWTLNFNNAMKLTGYFNTSVPVKGLKTTKPAVAAETALRNAYAHLLQPESVEFVKNDLMIHIINGQAVLCYKITVVAKNPMGEWVVFVDALSGKVIEAQNIVSDIDGTGSVYNTDPVTSAQTSYGTGNYVDNNDANNGDLSAQQFAVTLPNITLTGGQYKLEGPFAKIMDHDAPFSGLFTQASTNFSYNRTDDAFEAVMCYYHLDKSMNYVNNVLGISVMPQQYSGGVQYDPHALNGAANATYTSSTGRLAFGSPSNAVDAGEDAGIILHELGHGLHAWVMGGTNVSQQEGLSEGCADYWAKSYERSLGYWNPGEWGYDHVFFWGINPLFGGRSCNIFVSYPGGLSGLGFPHGQGQMWNSTLMLIWNDIGKEKTDRMFLTGLAMTNTSTNQSGAANACYQAAVNLGYSNYELCMIWNHFKNSYGSYFTPAQPSSGADIFIQDTPADFGTEVNPDNGPMWTSNDIWIRNTNDGGLVHQNPEYSTMNPNYIYVRIHGRGCTQVTDASLRVYFSKASTGLQWSSNWINYIIPQTGGPVLAGDEITTSPVAIPAIDAGEEVIIAIPWLVPNPSDFDYDIHHFCLLARIESTTDPMFVPEGTDINANTKNNNNIAWKNVSVFDLDPNNLTGTGVFIRNNSREQVTMNEIRFTNAAGEWNPAFNKNGQLFITLSPELYEIWEKNGRQGRNYKETGEKGRLQVSNEKFYLGGLQLKPGESYMAYVYYKPGKYARNCAFDLKQTDVTNPRKAVTVGGERFEYKPNIKLADPIKGDGTVVDVIAGTKTDQESILGGYTRMLFPNPADAFVQVQIPKGTSGGMIEINNAFGVKVKQQAFSVGTTSVKLNLLQLTPGIYYITIRNQDGLITGKEKLQKL